MKIYRNTFLYFRSYIFIIHQYIRPTCKIKEMTGPPRREKKVTLQKLHYLSILKVLMNALSYWEISFWTYISFICPKFIIRSVETSSLDIKCSKIGKTGKKTGEILMKSFGWFCHCNYINHWYRMCLYDQYIQEN